VDVRFDEHAAAGAAALALVEEKSRVSAFDGRVEIGVGEDDIRAFAAELERDALEIRATGGLHDELANFGAAGERYLVDIHMLGKRSACGFAEAGDYINYAGGEASFHCQFAHAQGG